MKEQREERFGDEEAKRIPALFPVPEAGMRTRTHHRDFSPGGANTMSTGGTTRDRAFYARDAAAVARDLLGDLLVHGETVGRIVETEAYHGRDDPGSHAHRGETPRNRTMFGPPGRAYVYLCYGVHEMFNVVTGPDGEPGAVLVRALEPVRGLAVMRRRRGVEEPEKLTSGPGKLTQAMDIDRRHDGHDLTSGELRIEAGDPVEAPETGPRVGLGVECDRPLRFHDGSRFVS